MDRARRIKPNRTWAEISMLLVDDAQMIELNQLYLGKKENTDVISFCYPPIPGEDGRFTGELIINIELAAKEGNRRKNTNASKELALYIAHGCDHLMDANDSDTAGRKLMRQRELRWLRIIAKIDEDALNDLVKI